MLYQHRIFSSSQEIAAWKERATEGDTSAEFRLAEAYDKGDGVQKNEVEAIGWYLKAAEQGNAKAQVALAIKYFTGEGLSKDLVEAMRWFHKAADQGDAFAQYRLGLAYYAGNGVPKNAVEAVRWLRKSAEQDYAKAQFNLGLLYADGDGVRKDLLEANFWVALGSSTTVEDDKAKELYDSIASQLSTSQRLAVLERYKIWVKAHPEHSMAGLAHMEIAASDDIAPETKRQMREMLAMQASTGFQKLADHIRVELSGDDHDVLIFSHPQMKDGLADSMMKRLKQGEANFWNGMRLMDYKAVVFSGGGYRRTVTRKEFVGYCKNYEAYKAAFLSNLQNMQGASQGK